MEKNLILVNSSRQPKTVPKIWPIPKEPEVFRTPERGWNRRHLETRRESLISIGSAIIVRGTKVLYYRLSDVIVTILVLLPLTVGFWRGVWQIMDHYSKEYILDPWVSIGIGNIIPLFFYYTQEPLKFYIHPTKMNYPCFYVITRFFLFIHAFASVNQWRGLWVFLDTQTGFGWESQVTSLVVGVVLLIQLKLLCNTLAIPLFVGVDEADSSIHDCPLRYATPPESRFKYFLDCVYSIVVVQSLVVSAWRGLWNLDTLYVYPSDELMSAILTTVTGNGIVIILCLLQPQYYKFMAKLKGLTRLTVFDLVTMIGFIGTVLSWKGVWDLCNVLIQFETPLRSEWVTTIIGGVGTMLLGCMSTVVIRGVTIDGVDSGDGTSEWPISYVSLLQKQSHSVPFPEPWVFRCCCTSQKVTSKISYTGKNLRSSNVLPKVTGSISKSEIDAIPLQNIQITANFSFSSSKPLIKMSSPINTSF